MRKSSKLKPLLHGSLKINHKSKLHEHQTTVCIFSNKNRPLVCFYSEALHFRLLAHLVLLSFLEWQYLDVDENTTKNADYQTMTSVLNAP